MSINGNSFINFTPLYNNSQILPGGCTTMAVGEEGGQTTIFAEGGMPPYPRPYPRPIPGPSPILIKMMKMLTDLIRKYIYRQQPPVYRRPPVTTMAMGEEGGGQCDPGRFAQNNMMQSSNINGINQAQSSSATNQYSANIMNILSNMGLYPAQLRNMGLG